MPLLVDDTSPARTLGEIQAIHKQTCTIMQATSIAKVSRRTIYNWLNAGKLRYIRTAGNSVRIFTESLFKPGEQP